MKKITSIFLVLSLLVLVGCSDDQQTKYQRYSRSFFETFNTVTIFMAYTETEEEFDFYFDYVNQRFIELHQLFDIYNSYEGINNLKTVNDNAGIMSVEVSEEIIKILTVAKKWSQEIGPKTNIAFGPVTKIWSDYRNDGSFDPENSQLPPMDKLIEASKYTNINDVVIDLEDSTVFLSKPEMRLDVGAIAKGYAVELVTQEIIEMGFISGAISGGGNIRTIGKPLAGQRETWNIGIQDPDAFVFSDNKNLDSVLVTDKSVVSSGDYQRYYYVGGELYHHIIDPETLMPGTYYRAVTVVTTDSGLADFLSTEVFLIPFEESFALVESLDDVEVLWVMPDGEIRMTDGMEELLSSKQ